MAFHLDADLLAFAVTTCTVIFGSKSSLQKNTRHIPTRYDLEEIPDPQLSEAQRKYLQPIDEQLGRMNYRPDCTFRAKNYGSNLMWHLEGGKGTKGSLVKFQMRPDPLAH